jgi:ribosomal protein L7/L12
VKAVADDPNRKIEAVVIYRDETGAGLADAKATVEDYIRHKHGGS